MRLAHPRCATATCQPAGRARSTWRSALLSVQPDTLLRWHRQLFRRFWRRKSPSAASGRGPTGTAETIARIRAMAAVNALLGAERIRGERRKLDIRVAQWTVQKDLGGGRPHGARDRPGRRSCATRRTTSGPATSSRSPTCFSEWFSSDMSSRRAVARGRLGLCQQGLRPPRFVQAHRC